MGDLERSDDIGHSIFSDLLNSKYCKIVWMGLITLIADGRPLPAVSGQIAGKFPSC